MAVSTNLYTNDIEIDYRGDEVTVDNVVKVLLGKQDSNTTTTSSRISSTSNENSHVLVYWTGHGGDSFFKFQDRPRNYRPPNCARLSTNA